MDIVKKKYNQKEVKELFDVFADEYETKLNSQKERIYFLLEENKKLVEELKSYKQKDELISSALMSAKEKAEEIELLAKSKYDLVIEKLIKFSADWKNYFDFLKEKYPNYATIQKAIKLKEALDESVTNIDKEQAFLAVEEKLASTVKNVVFDPKAKINDYIAATSESGFNIEEVLNPGKLELEDLCKELGLMD